MEYIAKQGDRLDLITFKHYGNLQMFPAVLQVNPHLLENPILKGGEKVFLPPQNKSLKKQQELWK